MKPTEPAPRAQEGRWAVHRQGSPAKASPPGAGPKAQAAAGPGLGSGPTLPPQPPHLVLSTLDSKGQKRTTILFTGRSTTRILDAIFFLPPTTAPSSPLAEAGNGGGGARRPPRRRLGNVVRGGLPPASTHPHFPRGVLSGPVAPLMGP